MIAAGVAGLALLLAATPSPTAPWSPRVHVRADESLSPDALRRLARPGVVLWLVTHSNTPKASALEALASFDEAYLRQRWPLLPGQVAQLDRAPRLGIRISGTDALQSGWSRLAGHPFAVDVTAPPSSEVEAAVLRLKPRRILVSGAIDLGTLSVLARWPGAKLLELGGAPCMAGGDPRVRWRLPSEALGAAGQPRCDARLQVDGADRLSDTSLTVLLARHPDVELAVDAGGDDDSVRHARQFLDRLAALFSIAEPLAR